MTRKTIILTLFSMLLFVSCKSQTDQYNTLNTPIDTTISFKIDNYWVTPNQAFDFNSLGKSSNDTLIIVTCAEYVYSPFGLMKDKYSLKKSLLTNFSITNRVDTMDNGVFEFQILKHNSSLLILFFDNDPEASKESYVFKGEIYDSDVNFSDNIKIGMSADNFYKTFFDNFPIPLQKRYKVVGFESCVVDIKHFYNFENNKLSSVNFVSDSYWIVNY